MTACPLCEHPLSSAKLDKDTVVCPGCTRPIELYPDGRAELSALYWAKGRVEYKDGNGLGGPGRSSFKTSDNDRGIDKIKF
jgi:uncharacterized protein YbaR (Trm112 family)